jgi:hypothetical protein
LIHIWLHIFSCIQTKFDQQNFKALDVFCICNFFIFWISWFPKVNHHQFFQNIESEYLIMWCINPISFRKITISLHIFQDFQGHWHTNLAIFSRSVRRHWQTNLIIFSSIFSKALAYQLGHMFKKLPNALAKQLDHIFITIFNRTGQSYWKFW